VLRNEHIILQDGKVCVITAYNGMQTAIDVDDIPLLRGRKVQIAKRGSTHYAYINIGNKTFYLHRLFMNVTDEVVLHINGNRLDNRKINLRIGTHEERFATGIKRSERYTSKYYGVFRDEPRNRWGVLLSNENLTIKEHFAEEKEAAIYYDFVAKEYGIGAQKLRLNFPDYNGEKPIPLARMKDNLTSSYRGIYLRNKGNSRWYFKVCNNGQKYDHGSFATEEQAAFERDKFILENLDNKNKKLHILNRSKSYSKINETPSGKFWFRIKCDKDRYFGLFDTKEEAVEEKRLICERFASQQ
jgi:hypothetical protein